jgi:hypothetical protein
MDTARIRNVTRYGASNFRSDCEKVVMACMMEKESPRIAETSTAWNRPTTDIAFRAVQLGATSVAAGRHGCFEIR